MSIKPCTCAHCIDASLIPRPLGAGRGGVRQVTRVGSGHYLECVLSPPSTSTEAEFAAQSAESDSDSELNLESEESHDKSSSESVVSILTQLRCRCCGIKKNNR